MKRLNPRNWRPLWFNLFFGALFVLGLILLFGPVLYNQQLQRQSDRMVVDYARQAKQQAPSVATKVKQFNANIFAHQQGKALPYPAITNFKQVQAKSDVPIGYVTIPSIKVQNTAIRYGDSDQVLSKGAGTMPGTSLPFGGKDTLSVVTGHSGLANRIVFDNIRYLKNGDVFYLTTFTGQTKAYQVYTKKVVDPNISSSVDAVRVQPGKDVAVLLTCTPLVLNTHRLLVYGKRIPYKQAQAKPVASRDTFSFYHLWLVIMSFLILLFVAWYLYLTLKRRLKKEAANDETKA